MAIYKYCPYCEEKFDEDVIHCSGCMATLRLVEEEIIEEREVIKEPDITYTEADIKAMEIETETAAGEDIINTEPFISNKEIRAKKGNKKARGKLKISKQSQKRMREKLVNG